MNHFDWIKRHAERSPDHLALIDSYSDRQFTYAAFNERANRLASFMQQKMGLKRGDRVSILAQNSSEYYEVLFACSKMGAILNTINWRLAVPEIGFILEDCSPRMLIYDSHFSESVAGLSAVEKDLNSIVIGGDGSETGWGYEDVLSAGSPDGVAFPSLAFDDTWAIIYTSGTTGKPKGAQVTFGNFFYNAIGITQAIDLTSWDVNLNVLPAFHAGGLGLYAGPIFHIGGTLVVMRAFDPASMLRLIERWQVTVIFLVPAIYQALGQFESFDDYDFSSVRSWGSGGSPLPPSLVHDFARRGIIIQQGFGMTETGPSVFLIDKEDAVRKAGSVGKPIMHTDVRIESAGGDQLGPGEVGELCVRGGNVTTGYWNRPEATSELLVDGWLHSGDAARYDEEGFYYIVDRWKDMYISGGENVYPAEVEDVIFRHPAVADVAVIGVPDERWQEVGLAVIVTKEGETLRPEEVFDFCQGKLARYKIPKSVEFVDVLPRTAAGKVLKRDLRQRFTD